MAHRAIMRTLQSWGLFWLAGAWLLWLVVSHLWPASYWSDVRGIHVEEQTAGQPVTITIDRVIKRPFVADWNVAVRAATETGWRIVCTADGGGEYRTDAVLPSPLTLDWWTDGECATLPEGRYQITTLWVLHHSIFPDKVIKEMSNVFEVTNG
jgi:hypothetical protein